MIKKEFLRDIISTLLHSHTTGIRYINFALVISVFLIGFSIDRIVSDGIITQAVPYTVVLIGGVLSLGIIISIFLKKPRTSRALNPFFFRSLKNYSKEEIEKDLLYTIKSEKRIIRKYAKQMESLSKTISKQNIKIKIIFGMIGISIIIAALSYVIIHFYL